MPSTRKNHPPSLKAKVAVEAIKEHKTAGQIAQTFGVHPTQVGFWKKQALAGLPDVFGNGRDQMREQADLEKDELWPVESGVGLSQKKSWPDEIIYSLATGWGGLARRITLLTSIDLGFHHLSEVSIGCANLTPLVRRKWHITALTALTSEFRINTLASNHPKESE